MSKKRIRVKLRADRFSFDGETGILVLAGTEGTVDTLTLVPRKTVHGKGKPEPFLTVFWDAALCQVATNDDPSVATGWEEGDVEPSAVDCIGVIDDPQES